MNKKQTKISIQTRIKEKIIRWFNLKSVIKKNFEFKKIDFLNIDAEGNDFKILKSLDFKTYRPTLICIEDTDLYNNKISDIKESKIYNFLIKLNYKYVRSGIFDHLYISN